MGLDQVLAAEQRRLSSRQRQCRRSCCLPSSRLQHALVVHAVQPAAADGPRSHVWRRVEHRLVCGSADQAQRWAKAIAAALEEQASSR